MHPGVQHAVSGREQAAVGQIGRPSRRNVCPGGMHAQLHRTGVGQRSGGPVYPGFSGGICILKAGPAGFCEDGSAITEDLCPAQSFPRAGPSRASQRVQIFCSMLSDLLTGGARGSSGFRFFQVSGRVRVLQHKQRRRSAAAATSLLHGVHMPPGSSCSLQSARANGAVAARAGRCLFQQHRSPGTALNLL